MAQLAPEVAKLTEQKPGGLLDRGAPALEEELPFVLVFRLDRVEELVRVHDREPDALRLKRS